MIVVNAASQMVALGAVLVVQTLYMIVVARVLGPEDFGRFSFAWTIAQILLIGGDLGLHNTALRKISTHPERSAAFCKTFFGLKMALSAILFLIAVLISLVIRETLETRIALLLFGAGMFFHSLSLAINIVFQSHGKLYWASLNVLTLFLAQFLFGILLLWWGARLIGLGVAYLSAACLSLALNTFIFQRTIHPLRLERTATWRRFAKESFPVGLGTLFHTVSARVGVALLTLLSGPYQAGIFAAANRITLSMSNVPIGIFSAILPVMASHQTDRAPVKRLFRKSLTVMIGISVVLSIGFFLLAEPLVQFLYGPAYQLSVGNLQVLTWCLIPVFVGMSFSHVILSQSRLVARLPVVTGAAMVANLGANSVLIPWMGSRGAAFSVLLTETVLAVGYALAVRSFLFSPVSPRPPTSGHS
ncbi:MAG: flippase [Acidobacteriota bacterium]